MSFETPNCTNSTIPDIVKAIDLELAEMKSLVWCLEARWIRYQWTSCPHVAFTNPARMKEFYETIRLRLRALPLSYDHALGKEWLDTHSLKFWCLVNRRGLVGENMVNYDSRYVYHDVRFCCIFSLLVDLDTSYSSYLRFEKLIERVKNMLTSRF